MNISVELQSEIHRLALTEGQPGCNLVKLGKAALELLTSNGIEVRVKYDPSTRFNPYCAICAVGDVTQAGHEKTPVRAMERALDRLVLVA